VAVADAVDAFVPGVAEAVVDVAVEIFVLAPGILSAEAAAAAAGSDETEWESLAFEDSLPPINQN
jgi:hypothetical protein